MTQPLANDRRILGYLEDGRPVYAIAGGVDPPPPPDTTETPPTTDTSADAVVPPLPAATVRPPIRRKPAAPVDAAPEAPTAPDGVGTEEWSRFKSWQTEVESKRPELDRARADLAKTQRQLAEHTTRERDYQRQIAQQAEANFHLVLSAEAAAIGQAVQLLPEAGEDLLAYLDRHTHTAQDGTDSTVVFRDGKVEIDLNDADARKKIGEHLVKVRPHWITSRLAAGGGGAGRPAALIAGKAKPPANVDELAAALARGQLTSIAGGRAAGGR